MLSNKRNILFLILILNPVLLTAQNWCTVNKKSLNYFLCSNGEYKAIKIKTVQVTGNDTVLYPVKEGTINDQNLYCIFIDSVCFIGQKIKIKPNGINILYNNEGEEIIINTLAKPGDNWTLFLCKDSSRFIARVDLVFFYELFSGLSDSIKFITLNYFDKNGNIVYHPANNSKILISKNYGLFSFEGFISISNIKSNYSLFTYSLEGMSNPKFGYQNLNSALIYDFDIGDEFHTEAHESYNWKFDLNRYHSNYNDYCIRKIINKIETEDTFYYFVSRKKRSINGKSDDIQGGHYSIDSSVTEDTIKEKYSKTNEDIDRLPNQAILSYSPECAAGVGYRLNYYKTFLSFGTVRTKQNNYSDQPVFNILDTCIDSHFCWNSSINYENYYDGLGGPYYYLNDDETYESTREYYLVYFKKGSKEWGTPIIIKNKPQVKSFIISPNPASNRILISINSKKLIDNLIITDISGNIQTQLNNINSGEYEMDCRYLNKGWYIVSIISGGDVYRKQLLIIR